MTVEICVAQCYMEGHYFAILFNGTFCYCNTEIFAFRSITQYSKVKPDHECSTPCPGNLHEMCGGPDAVSIYSVDGKTALILIQLFVDLFLHICL